MMAGNSFWTWGALAAGAAGLYSLLHVSAGRRDARLWIGMVLVLLALSVIGGEHWRPNSAWSATIMSGLLSACALAFSVISAVARPQTWSLRAFGGAAACTAGAMWPSVGPAGAAALLLIAGAAVAWSVIPSQFIAQRTEADAHAGFAPHEPLLACLLWGLLAAGLMAAVPNSEQGRDDLPTDIGFLRLNNQLLLGSLLFATGSMGYVAGRRSVGSSPALAVMSLGGVVIVLACAPSRRDAGGETLALAALAFVVIDAALMRAMTVGAVATEADGGTSSGPGTSAP